MSGEQYIGAMTPEQETRTIQSAKLRATWQRFATSHQNNDIEGTNASLDVHIREMRAVYGFQHDTLQQSLTSSLSKQQETQLNLKNHQQDLPKVLAKELENQIKYLQQMVESGEGDQTLPLSRAHGILLYLVILARCSENIQQLSKSQLDVSLSFAALAAAQALAKPTNANSSLAISNWLQAILLEITCYYSFMCDRQNNWMNIVKSCKEETLQDALSLDGNITSSQPTLLHSNLNSHNVTNSTARGNFRMAINAIFNSKECKVKQKLLGLDLLGTFLCGGETTPVILVEICNNHTAHYMTETSCGIINDSTFSALLSLMNTCSEHRDLVIQCVLIYIQQTHNSRPDKRQIDVRSLLSIFLQEISQKAKDTSYDMLSLYIDMIPRILRVKDRPSLQSSFLGVFVFDKLFRVLSDCSERERVIVSCIRAYSALMRKSASSKEEFEAHIGYQKLLSTITNPTRDIVCALLDMVVEGRHDAEFAVIENIELLKIFLKWSFTMDNDPNDELLLYILGTLHNIVSNNTLSIMRCCSGGIITVITNVLSAPSKPLAGSLVEQLMCILEQIGGYSISAIEVRQFILLFQVDNKIVSKIPHFTDRLQVALERMARGKGAEGPNHFFDLQHQTAGITVPEIKAWPHGKNCYTFVCWFKLDLKSVGQRPLSPDAVATEERYTLYSFYNASGFGFEAFFQPDGSLHIGVCNRKEFTTTSVDHTFLDNKWHFLGISHRGSPLGMGEVCVKVDKKLTNKLQLASISCNQPFTSNTVGGAGLRQAHSKDRRGSGSILTEFGSFITSKTTANKDINVVTVTPGLQDEHYGIPTSLHGQLGPVALFGESLTPQELIDIHAIGPNNLSLFQPHYTGQRKETLSYLADKLVLYYNAKASRDHLVLDLVSGKIPTDRLDGRLTGHNLSTWNIKDILACVGGVQLIFPLLESIGPVQYAQSPAQMQLRPVFLRCHYTSDASVGVYEGAIAEVGEDAVASGTASPAGFDIVKQSGSIESLPEDHELQTAQDDAAERGNDKTEANRVARFFVLLEEMLRDCPTNHESLLSTNGFAVIGALLINIPPEELNMTLVKALQSLCLLLSYDVNPINSSDEAYSPLLLDIYQHILFNFELWAKVEHEVRVAHIQYLSVIIKDNLQLCRKLYGVQFMLDAVRLYCSSSVVQPDTACVLRRAIFGFVKYYMRHGIQISEVKAILSFIAVTPDLDQKLEGIELITVLVDVPPTSLPLARSLSSQDAQDLLVGLLHTPCNELKIALLVLIRTIVDTCTRNNIPLHSTQLCYVGEAVVACSIDGNPEIVNEMLATITIVVTSATDQGQQPDVMLMQSLVYLLPRFSLSTRLHVCQELLVLTRTNPKLGECYSLLPAWYNAVLCLMLGSEEDGGLPEQLFVTVMELLHTVLWRYYEKSEALGKQQIGRLILTIDDLGERLFKSTHDIKMRLFELILHSMNLDLKKSGYDGQIADDHISLLELLEHFMFSKEEDEGGDWSDLSCVKSWSSKLVQEILLFFNLLGVWESGSNMELYRISLRVLLGCLHHQSYEYVSTAASKLDRLLDHPYFESFYTASYVLGTLHYVLTPTLEDEVNQLHILLVPLVHTALSRWGTILGLSQDILDQMPTEEHDPDFMDDFLTYIDTHEWETFICNQVYPAVAKFSKENNDTAVAGAARGLSKVQELLEEDIIVLNQAKVERLTGYEKDITAQFLKRHEFEVNRHILDTNGRHNKHHAIIKEWKERKKFMTSDRGVWGGDGNKADVFWKRDTHENYTRMRLRTCPNNEFDPHLDAKFYDEYDYTREANTVNLLGVSEEARIRSDRETLESWEVILNSKIPDLTDDDQLVFFQDCHLVTLLNIIPGTLKVSPTHIYFYEQDSSNHKISHHNISWKIKHIREIHLRRYNLRYSAMEFFLTDQTNIFINFSKYHRNKVYSKIMALRPPNLVHGITRSPEEMLASSNLTRKWIERRISNFEYLMNLNTIAGRTYNDLSQYPVFPWVLNDYSSDSIDFSSPLCNCFRDLSKPIGAQVPERAEHADIKYQSLPQGGFDPPFHYGTHYSNPGAILYFLVRMEPYTSLHIELHGRFDHPDRQFYNIGQSYDSSTKGQGDCKELIPEFYYLPEFLVNSNAFDFGKRHDGSQLNDVMLPNWAKSPEDFIVKHRAALESDYVSNNLHNWIDLIFGYKQRGEESIKALNVYHYTSYEGMVDLDNEKDPKKRRALEAQISNFGQTPRHIFKEPHPKRISLSEASSLKGSNIHHILRAAALKANAIQMGTADNPIIFVGVSGGGANQVIERGVMDNLVTISLNGVYGIHNWLSRWSGSHPFYCEKDTQLEEGVRSISGPFSPSSQALCNVVRLSSDGKVLFVGGLWDNSIRVGLVNQHEIISQSVLYQHKNVITCLELDGKYLATGGRDTTVVIWKLLKRDGECRGLKPHPGSILYGHNSEVTCVALSQELDLVVSGSSEGIVLLHTLKFGTYIRTLVPHVPADPEAGHFSVGFVGIASSGNIVIAGRLPSKSATFHSVLYLYTVNGRLVKRVKLEDETTAVYLDQDRLVLGGAAGSLEIRCTDYIAVKHKLRLKSGVLSISKDPRNQHLFVTTADGKLLIITATAKPFKR